MAIAWSYQVVNFEKVSLDFFDTIEFIGIATVSYCSRSNFRGILSCRTLRWQTCSLRTPGRPRTECALFTPFSRTNCCCYCCYMTFWTLRCLAYRTVELFSNIALFDSIIEQICIRYYTITLVFCAYFDFYYLSAV